MLLFKCGVMRRMVAMLLAWSLAGVGVAAQGYIEKGGVRMDVADSVAVLDKRLNDLTIYLLPTRLTEHEKRRIGKGHALLVLANKASPDDSKWNGYPYATLELHHRSRRFDSADDLYGYALMNYGIRKKNQVNTVNGYFTDKEVMRGYRFDDGRIQFTFSAQRQAFDTRWQLDVNAPIIRRKKEKSAMNGFGGQ
ncbi:hypothetical protein [Thiohalophilus sp.]|uniref:hypothetical protein n=1 Tax=Thiohalophilus sp. TaxID=3028392 RepID=UPI002ACD4202|nr:hypothetical protein [Thiohalophilus sp.]MDZ7805466.1 hypothetical protein [Thiohalophilus sp.]